MTIGAFVVLATANSAGYRYGASDLAFYGPAVMRQLDPELFPRDTPVIEAQARLTFMDETVAAAARLFTRRLPALFLGLYVATLLVLTFGATAIGQSIYRNRWTSMAFVAALTLRHAIAKSGTNTLEGYFHPRQLAFAFGTLAVAAFLRGRILLSALALIAAGSLHPTTTLWLTLWLGMATLVARPRWRTSLLLAIAATVALSVWTLTYGPLAGRLIRMDPEWLAALGDKDYLFPLRWPVSAWVSNLGYVAIILWAFARRDKAGLTTSEEAGLVVGAMALTVTFAVAVVLNASNVALAIQLQPARVFWMLDFLAVLYVVWAVAEGDAGFRRRPVYAAIALAVLSVARGAYVMKVEFPDRRLFETGVPGDWGRVAEWAATTPKSSGWLADPFHAARYGSSLRMAAARDVFVEGTKDAAIGMYDRSIALRTQERLKQVQDFAGLDAARAQGLGRDYQLDYLVSERALPLPVAFQSGLIRVYRIR